MPASAVGPGGTVTVVKTPRQQKIIGAGAACNVEWTHLEVPGSPAFWTFGVEAFATNGAHGERGALLDTLEEALAQLAIASPAAPELRDTWLERSYPAWLIDL